MEGWIKLYREVTTKNIYHMPPLYLRVFERLTLEANSRCKRIPYGKETKLIKRGEKLTSIGQIAEWVGWYERGVFRVPNKKTISVILDWLIKNELIEIRDKGNARETHYNIVNYCVYQSTDDNESNAKVTPTGHKQERKERKEIKNKDKEIYTPDFENFWTIYPRPQAKADTYKSFCRLKKEISLELIMQCTQNYVDYVKQTPEDERIYAYSSNNFLGQKAYYKDFDKPKKYIPKKPKLVLIPNNENFIQREYDKDYFESLYEEV